MFSSQETAVAMSGDVEESSQPTLSLEMQGAQKGGSWTMHSPPHLLESLRGLCLAAALGERGMCEKESLPLEGSCQHKYSIV